MLRNMLYKFLRNMLREPGVPDSRNESIAVARTTVRRLLRSGH